MEMEDQYGMADLRQLMTNGSSSSIPYFPVIPQVHHQQQDLLFSGVGGHRNLTHAAPNHHHHHHSHPHPHHYEMMMLAGSGGRHHQVQVNHEMLPLHLHTTDSTTTAPTTTATTTTTTTNSAGGGGGGGGTSSGTLSGLESADIVGCIGGGGGGDGGTGRWPRQETLSLLEIRSRLDHKFKEANQKGPLWDEVSRIMSEEHGYQRSGKKCREKFENLYKYYKKTKEGKAGRQDGKHYRFFRQLEALYGSEATNNNNNPVSSLSESHLIGQNLPFHSAINNNSSSHQLANDHSNQEAFQQAPKLCDSLSLSNSSEFDTSSSDDSVEKSKKRRGGGGSRRSWKAKIREFIDSQMRKLMEKQEAWLDKMMRTIEHKEQERVSREEEWRKQEAARLDREHKFWASERAWIEARDAALMEALHKLTGKEINKAAAAEFPNENDITSSGGESWPEPEITKLIQLRISMESRFQHSECSAEEVLWEEIAAKMGCLGYDHRRSAIMCKDKWESINNYLRKTKDCDIYKKRKEDSSKSSSSYYQNNGDHEISLYNQGLIGEQGPEMLSLLQPNNDGSSSSPPSNSNAGNNNTVQESSFRFFMGDGDHQNLWENYGVKLNNQQGGN